MKRIAIIPARSGSKGLKDKNIIPLCGKPLIAHSIECAINSGEFDKVFVSTDSQEYADVSKKYGADASFLRSTENSTDTAGSWDVVKEVIEHFEKMGIFFDEIMLLQATSPLRNVEDIKGSIQVMKDKQANSVVSVTEMEHSPYWSDILPEDSCMDHFGENEYYDLPRQQIPVHHRLNGAIYLIKRAELDQEPMFRNRSYAYTMPRERSVDIDDKMDLLIAEAYLKAED